MEDKRFAVVETELGLEPSVLPVDPVYFSSLSAQTAGVRAAASKLTVVAADRVIRSLRVRADAINKFASQQHQSNLLLAELDAEARHSEAALEALAHSVKAMAGSA